MPDNLISMPATPAEREKHRKAGELMVADKARWLVTQRAVQLWQQPPTPAEAALNAFFVMVAIAGGIAALYFIAHQVAVWAQ